MPETRAEPELPDRVTPNIDTMLISFSSEPSKPSMFRVGDHLRSSNPEAYDPVILAIGPFHRSNSKLQKMEQHKVRYLKLLLRRRGESSVERYVTRIKQSEDEARKCYADDIQLDKDEFVQMLILDGCFIIEFLHKFQHEASRDEGDPIFQYGHMQSHLLHDLMVFENQIPFFIINRLFEMIYNGVNINTLIWPLLQNSIFPARDLPPVPDNAQHLLGIVHDFQCSSFARILSLPHMDSGNSDETKNINSAVELKEAGISFKRSEGDNISTVHGHSFRSLRPLPCLCSPSHRLRLLFSHTSMISRRGTDSMCLKLGTMYGNSNYY